MAEAIAKSMYTQSQYSALLFCAERYLSVIPHMRVKMLISKQFRLQSFKSSSMFIMNIGAARKTKLIKAPLTGTFFSGCSSANIYGKSPSLLIVYIIILLEITLAKLTDERPNKAEKYIIKVTYSKP